MDINIGTQKVKSPASSNISRARGANIPVDSSELGSASKPESFLTSYVREAQTSNRHGHSRSGGRGVHG